MPARLRCRPLPRTPAANGASASPANAAEAIALDELIAAHQATHGDFADTAAIARALKAVLDVAAARLGAVHREALGQIAVKLARICAGDPTCADHWRDLAGYAWLAGRDLAESRFRSGAPSGDAARLLAETERCPAKKMGQPRKRPSPRL